MPDQSSTPYLPLEQGQLTADLVAGLTFAVVSVPQAMGNALLALVNPVHGLYTLMIATPVGALFTSSVFMNVTTTGALSVAVGDVLVYLPDAQKTSALVGLVLLIGVFQLILGVLKLGALIRFVSQPVMIGFITGIAANIILGAIPNLTGYTSPYYIEIPKLADTLLNVGQFDPLTVILGLATIGLIFAFGYTRWGKFAMILALAVMTGVSVFLTNVFGIDSVELVGDIATIPRSLPRPMLPDLSLIPVLILPAVSIGVVGLVQGAGVGQSFPNPHGKYPDVSRDFAGEGVANIAASFFQGIPGGGTIPGTAISVNAGAKSRWASIFAGLLVAVIVLVFVDMVKLIPMTALGGLLVAIGIQSLQPEQIAIVWQTGQVDRTAFILTLLATLTMPLQFAILVGVAISVLLHVLQTSNRIEVVEFVPVDGGFPMVRPAPAELPGREVTLLYAYGSLFFASASTFEKKLPSADGAQQAVVILILRGRPEVGSTFIGVLRRYTKTLQANGGKVILAGVSPSLRDQLEKTGTMVLIGEENLFMTQDQLGAPANDALAAARVWLAKAESESIP